MYIRHPINLADVDFPVFAEWGSTGVTENPARMHPRPFFDLSVNGYSRKRVPEVFEVKRLVSDYLLPGFGNKPSKECVPDTQAISSWEFEVGGKGL
jgi:hypothetical protein